MSHRLVAHDLPLTGCEPAVDERRQQALLTGQLAGQDVTHRRGEVGCLADPPVGGAQAEGEHTEGVAEVAEDLVDPGVVGRDRVERALVEGAAGGQRGDDHRVDQFVVQAQLGGEPGEPAIEGPLAAPVRRRHVVERLGQLGGAGPQGPADMRQDVGSADVGGGIGVLSAHGHGGGPFCHDYIVGAST